MKRCRWAPLQRNTVQGWVYRGGSTGSTHPRRPLASVITPFSEAREDYDKGEVRKMNDHDEFRADVLSSPKARSYTPPGIYKMSVERAASFSGVALEVIGPRKVTSQYQLAARAPEGCQKQVHSCVAMNGLLQSTIGLTMAPEPLQRSQFAPRTPGLA